MGSAPFAELISQENKRWVEVIRELKITKD
jgi:hypothetical protein